ncbi:MAG: hypothetical protein ACK5DE_02480 [Bacteroidota bacterium]|jgi:hypothetical protein
MNKIPVYAEDKPHRRFLNEIKKWLKDRGIQASALLVSKSNLVIAVIPGMQGSSLFCFYIQKLCALGTGGIIVYYDLSAMSTRLKMNVENTFTNWLAQSSVT